MQEIRIISWGLGAMGSGIAAAINNKQGIRIVGAIDQDPDKIGQDLGTVLNCSPLQVKVESDFTLSEKAADLVILATSSFTKEVFPLIKRIIAAKINVITIAEEMAYPQAQSPQLAAQIDQLAREQGVSVLGTGINPGFILDTLILALSGACLEVKKIEAERVNDLSPFGPTVMRTQGVGTTPAEFKAGLEQGRIVGHIGFSESIKMIADRLGLELDEIKESREAIVSNTYRETPHVKVEPGMVAGCCHIARGISKGEEVIVLEHPQQIHPQLEDVETGDYIRIKGTPDLNLAIQPETPGGIGTMAVALNMIPLVIKAEAGLLSMKDLPVPSAILGDFRQLIANQY